MSGLSTRDALAEVLAKHRLHASMNICTGCDWRPTQYAGMLADQHEAHRADQIFASGAVVDVTTLADDEALVGHIQNWVPLGFRADRDPYANTYEAAQAILRALAAALTERDGAA